MQCEALGWHLVVSLHIAIPHLTPLNFLDHANHLWKFRNSIDLVHKCPTPSCKVLCSNKKDKCASNSGHFAQFVCSVQLGSGTASNRTNGFFWVLYWHNYMITSFWLFHWTVYFIIMYLCCVVSAGWTTSCCGPHLFPVHSSTKRDGHPAPGPRSDCGCRGCPGSMVTNSTICKILLSYSIRSCCILSALFLVYNDPGGGCRDTEYCGSLDVIMPALQHKYDRFFYTWVE